MVQPQKLTVAVAIVLLLVGHQQTEAKKKKKPVVAREGPQDDDVFARGLVHSKVTATQVLQESGSYFRNTSRRSFSGPVLAYVTPWNAAGYVNALRFRAKFSHISPVWYQLRRTGGVFELTGRHDVDTGWLSNLRTPADPGGRVPRVVPRLLLEVGPADQADLLTADADAVVSTLVQECRMQQYDGLVLEAWSQWVAMGMLREPMMRGAVLSFVRRLAAALHAMPTPSGNAAELLLAVPPVQPAYGGLALAEQDMADLVQEVDAFSVMTYDYSSPARPGPNAPLPWVEANLQRLTARLPRAGGAATHNRVARRVLLGLNFYGNKYTLPQGGNPIVVHEYLDLLRQHRPRMQADEEAAEDYFTYTDTHAGHKCVVYYPTPWSLSERLALAERQGTGVAIWEIGQGPQWLYDLL